MRQLKGLPEHCKLTQWRPGRVPIEIYFDAFLIVKSGTYGENTASDITDRTIFT